MNVIQMETVQNELIKYLKKTTIQCDLPGCHRTFDSKKLLKIHKNEHNHKKIFCCHICNKTFSRSFTLRRHYIIHSGESPYKCDYSGCSKRFNTSSNLARHRRIHTKLALTKASSDIFIENHPIKNIECFDQQKSVNDLFSHNEVDFLMDIFFNQNPTTKMGHEFEYTKNLQEVPDWKIDENTELFLDDVLPPNSLLQDNSQLFCNSNFAFMI